MAYPSATRRTTPPERYPVRRTEVRDHAGDIDTWLDAIVDGEIDRLELSGDRPLARAVVERLSEILFVARAAAGAR
jgi:hypothetical protein